MVRLIEARRYKDDIMIHTYVHKNVHCKFDICLTNAIDHP